MIKQKLGDIKIGYSDAKTDDNKYYFDGLKYLEILEKDNKKFIILGEKGSGKTCLALGYKNKQESEGASVKMIYSSEMSEEMISCDIVIKSVESMDGNKLISFYKYYLLIIVGKTLLDKRISFQLLKKIIKHPIKYFFNKFRLKCIIETCESNFKLAKIENNGEFQAGQLLNNSINLNSKVGFLHTYVNKEFSSINNKIEKYIKVLTEYISIVLVFDDLEDYEIFSNNKMQIEKFIYVVQEINDKLIGNNGRVIVVLKNNIFEHINSRSNNLNKIKADRSIEINWNKNYNENSLPPLIELIMMKIINNNPCYQKYKPDKLYNSLFPTNVKGIPIKQYIINATYGRPRDIIMMLTEIQSMFPDETKFTEYHFLNTRSQYSRYFFRELENDLTVDLSVNDKKLLFDVFRNIGQFKFDKKKILEYFETMNFEKKFTIDEFIDYCFDNNIIGYISQDAKGKEHYNWKYIQTGIKCDKDKKLALHNGLVKYLIGK